MFLDIWKHVKCFSRFRFKIYLNSYIEFKRHSNEKEYNFFWEF